MTTSEQTTPTLSARRTGAEEAYLLLRTVSTVAPIVFVGALALARLAGDRTRR